VRPYLEKKPSQKRAGRVAQGVGPEFKLQYWKKKKRKKEKKKNPKEVTEGPEQGQSLQVALQGDLRRWYKMVAEAPRRS
jgi:hypothetical protein